jgi:hypothetical protein
MMFREGRWVGASPRGKTGTCLFIEFIRINQLTIRRYAWQLAPRDESNKGAPFQMESHQLEFEGSQHEQGVNSIKPKWAYF